MRGLNVQIINIFDRIPTLHSTVIKGIDKWLFFKEN